MTSNHIAKVLSIAGRWMATALFCLTAVAIVWQIASITASVATASPISTMIATTDMGDQVRNKTDEAARKNKDFVRDTADKVERTASQNANRISNATDGKGGYFQRKAERDAARIHKRAEEDAARTQKAIDKTKNAVKDTVKDLGDSFNN